MNPVPSFTNVPIFGSGATLIAPTPSVYAGGYLPGQAYPAENHNFFLNGLTGNGLTEQSAIISLLTEFTNFFTAYGVTPNAGLTNQFLTTFQTQLALKANLESPTFTGTVTIPTVPAPTVAGNPTTKAYVDNAVSTINSALALLAPLASPVFTGIPIAPTPSNGDNSTKIATTAFVAAAVSAGTGALPITSLSHQEFSGASGNQQISAMVVGEMRFVTITGGANSSALLAPATGTFLALQQAATPHTNPFSAGATIGTLGSGQTFSTIIVRTS